MNYDEFPEIVTPEEIAERLRVKPENVMKAARDGSLKALKVGKFWRIERSAVKEWIEKSSGRKE